MYLNQSLRIKWNSVYTDYFSVCNGVKKGGVISPVLFCVYIDGLLKELEGCGVGCYMGKVFAGAFGYADDLVELSPSVSTLHKMVGVCERYADKYDVIFNAKKSQLIVYGCSQSKPPNPEIRISGKTVEVVNGAIHLGHFLSDNISDFRTSKCIGDFNRQCRRNMFLAEFKNASLYMRNTLFQKHCTGIYGTQILPLFDRYMTDIK